MKYIFLLTGILFSVVSFSQNRQGGGSDMPAEGVISGYVIDKESSKPFEYANIVIYSKRDSSIVSGGITDKNGYFRIDKVRYGKFFVEVNFIGYGKHIIPEVAIKPEKKEIDLGKVYLSINAEMLNEVSVEANVNQVDYRLDRKVVNVNQDIISAGATAVEVLENVPSITTDIDGNVALRGSESFLVMVDGRPSPIQGSEALQQIPASSIESIEIITNPSAKYDPDGVGGIINIVLKKDKRAGYNGQISANVGSFYTHGGDALFNFRTQKVNFFIGGEYGDRRHKGEGESHRESYINDTSTFILNNFSQNYRDMKSGSFRTGIDYYVNDNEIITISGRYGLSGHGMGNSAWSGSWYEYDDINNRQDFYYYISNTDMESSRSYFSGDINYMKKFKKAGHEIQVFGSYAGDFEDEENYFNETLSDHMQNPIGDIISEHRTIESGNGNTITAKADYVLPLFEKGKFETGYQLKISTLNNDYRYQTFVSDEWADDPTQINPYTYTNNIQSGYAIFANYWKKLGYQVGIRTEYTDRLFHQTTTDQKWAYNKFDFFPSVHLSYQLPAEMQLLASYSRRLDRPRGWYLDPFVEIVDPNNIRQGNPNLLPEYTNSFDLSFQKKFDQHFVSVEAYMRQTYNKISWITVVNPENPNIFIMTFDNIGEDLSAGGELMANLNLTKWYNLNISGSGFYYELISEDYNSGSTFSWTARLNNTFRLKKTGTSIQIGANYNGPQISAQGTRSASWAASGGIRQDFLDRKLSLSLNFRNIFRTMKMESISETDSFYQYSLRYPRGPIVTFSVTYKINDFKNRKDKGLDNDYDGGEEGGM